MTMPLSRARAMLLSLLALLLVGSFAASTANAEGGPFWHERPEGGKGEGTLLTGEEGPDGQGSGGVQTLTGEVAGTPIEIQAKEQQVKIQLYNTPDQAQAKIWLKYHEPKLVKPVLSGCVVEIGKGNEVKVFGHQGWKWNGEKKQLEEKPQKEQRVDWIFTPTELAQGATELPKGTFTTISLKGTGCGALVGTFNVTGSTTGEPTPNTLETWSKEQTTKYPGPPKQHFWNGKAFIGVEPALVFAGNPAVLKGEDKIKFDLTIEAALFEK
jgi:hypothetical protein